MRTEFSPIQVVAAIAAVVVVLGGIFWFTSSRAGAPPPIPMAPGNATGGGLRLPGGTGAAPGGAMSPALPGAPTAPGGGGMPMIPPPTPGR